jgi:hypothetical protein
VSIAIHESGHAVASVVLGLNLQWVTLNPPVEPRNDGLVTIGLTCSLPNRSVSDEERFIIDICGLLAEAQAKDISDEELSEAVDRSVDDLRSCEKVLPSLTEEQAQLSVCRAASLVVTHWEAIRLVAVALEIGDTLTGEYVAGMVRSCQ